MENVTEARLKLLEPLRAPHRGKRAASRTVNDTLYFFRINKKPEISFWHHKSVAYRLTTNLKILDDQSG